MKAGTELCVDVWWAESGWQQPSVVSYPGSMECADLVQSQAVTAHSSSAPRQAGTVFFMTNTMGILFF